MRPRTMPVLALALVLLAVAPACGPGQETGRAPGDQPSTDLYAIAVPPAELATAEAEAVRGCLRDRGFAAPAPPPPAMGTANIPAFLTPEAARSGGYGPGPGDALDRYAATLTAERQAALQAALIDPRSPRTGFTTPDGWEVRTRTGGCFSDARRALYGSLADWLLVQALPQDLNDVAAATLTDDRLAPALDRYAGCMRAHGRDVRYPQEAAEQATGPDARPIAVDDAVCQASADLRSAYLTVFADRATGWLAANDDLVRRAAAVTRAATARATGSHVEA